VHRKVRHLRAFRALVLVVVVALTLSGCLPPPERPRSGPGEPREAARSALAVPPVLRAPADASVWGRLPLYFVENRGQLDPRVGYAVGQRGGMAYFTPEGVTYGIVARPDEEIAAYWDEAAPADEVLPRRRWVVKVDFLGGDVQPRPVGLEQTDGVFSIFKGAPEEWKTSLPTYRGVGYQSVWPGVDVTYTSDLGHLKYSVVIQPGGDPRQIALGYRGATETRIAEDGGLEVMTPLGLIRESAPVTFQEVDGQQIAVPSAFTLQHDAELGTSTVGFEVGAYDPTVPLVIDPPVIVYLGYVGGTNPNGFDDARNLAVDGEGSLYVGGGTTSTEATFPETVGPDLTFAGSVDAFVAKVQPNGSALVYAGFVGGTQREDGLGITVDDDGNAYLTGQTFTTQGQGFPLTVGAFDVEHNGQADVFVTKVNPAGTGLVYSTYVGGSSVEAAQGIRLDPGCQSNCAAYVVGETGSTNLFPNGLPGVDQTFNGGNSGSGFATDAFIFKINGAGNGLVGADNESGRELAVDAGGNAYVVGVTLSTEATFPNGTGLAGLGVPGFDQTFNGQTDAFVAKINAAGTAYTYVTYLGGASGDGGLNMGIVVDTAGNAYVAGDTLSGTTATTQFPTNVGPDTSHNGSSDVFITKLNPAGTALIYSGFIGGSQSEAIGGVAIDSIGNAYVVGRTNSSQAQGFPLVNPIDATFGGNADVFISKVRPDGGALTFSTYLGGINLDEGQGVVLDSGGNIYLVGGSGSNESQEFPVTVGPDLTFNGGGADVFVAKLGITADLAVTITDAPDPITAGQVLTYTVTVSNNGPDDVLGVTLNDPLPAGTTLSSATPAQGTCTGTSVVICNLGGLANGVSAAVQIAVVPSEAGTLSNTVTASSLTADPTQANNSATTTTAVNAVADLATSLLIEPSPGLVGGALTYAVSVKNNGPSAATGVTATVTWPPVVTFGSAAPGQGTCTNSPGQVACNLGTIASGATVSIAIAVTPNSATTIATTASATSAVTDPNAANNSVTVNSSIVSATSLADLAVTVVDTPDPAEVGSPVTYTATVTNNGPNPATAAQLNATLPDGSSLVSATAAQGTCAANGTAIECALGSLTSGASTAVTIVVTPSLTGPVALTASVTSGIPDTPLTNNTAAQITTVNAAPVGGGGGGGGGGGTPCSPRPDVRLTVVSGGPGRLNVTVRAGTNAGTPTNTLSALRFGAATNALIDIPGGQTGLTGNTTITLPAGSTETSFVVRQQAGGSGTTVPLVVVDSCGDFPTFVGGGPAAFQ
jgi:uncharacterized repeat protein (TIGR01451 family)